MKRVSQIRKARQIDREDNQRCISVRLSTAHAVENRVGMAQQA
jgi:hypothetical protein